MKTTKFILSRIFTAVLMLSLSINGCKKDSDATDDFATDAAEIGQMESVHTDVDNMVEESAKMSSGSTIDQRLPSSIYEQDAFGLRVCGTVTNDSITHTITIDFGSGCTGRDGKTRSGRIITTYTGHYFDAGASWTTTFDNFYVDGRHIEGTRTVTNNGLNNAGNMTWTIDAQNMRITRPNGEWRTWNSLRTREMLAGFGDSLWANDKYRINGTANGSNSNGRSVSATLTNLIRDNTCHFITSGTITVVPAGHQGFSIDFGSGTCDDLATVNRNGNTRTIHLRW